MKIDQLWKITYPPPIRHINLDLKIENKKKTVDKFEFKGDLNIRHLSNEMLKDKKKYFIIHSKTSTIMAVRRDMDISAGYYSDVVVNEDKEMMCTDTEFSYPFMFKNVEPAAIGQMKQFIKEKSKEMKKHHKKIKRKGNEGSPTTVLSF